MSIRFPFASHNPTLLRTKVIHLSGTLSGSTLVQGTIDSYNRSKELTRIFVMRG